jgi:hypothetical protein
MRRIARQFARIASDGSEQKFTLIGRNAWALENLAREGSRGCTPIEHPGPRWSGYVHRLRKDFGLNIRTIEEQHGGPFPGKHARYVLDDDVRICDDDAV